MVQQPQGQAGSVQSDAEGMLENLDSLQISFQISTQDMCSMFPHSYNPTLESEYASMANDWKDQPLPVTETVEYAYPEDRWSSLEQVDNNQNLQPELEKASMTRPHSPLAGWKVKEELTVRDWQECRPIFEKLYIEENRKLEQIMEIMKNVYGFSATKSQYKNRISSWNLRKNYKATEKDQIARLIEQCHETGQNIPNIRVRNRQVDLHKVRRHVKSKQGADVIKQYLVTRKRNGAARLSSKALPALEDKDVAALVSETNLQPQPRGRGPCSSLQPALNTATGRVEFVLQHVRNYVEGFVLQGDASSGELSSVVTGYPLPVEEEKQAFGQLRAMQDKLIYGCGILVENPTTETWQRAWRLMNEGCDMMSTVLSKQSRSLMRLLLRTFGGEGWDRFPELRANLLRHFAKVAVVRLGRFHPLTAILFSLQETEVLEMVLESAFPLLVDVLDEKLDPTDDESRFLRVDYCFLLRERKNYIAAEKYGRLFLADSERLRGKNHDATRGFLLKLADVYMHQKLYDQASQVLNDVLVRTHEALGENIDITGVYAHRNLGWIHERREESVLSQSHWLAVNEAALRIWGPGTEKYAYFAAEAVESLRKQGLPSADFIV